MKDGPAAIALAVAALGTWRVAHLLHAEDGPWSILAHVRDSAAMRRFGALDCFKCISLWAALPVAVVSSGSIRQGLVLWPALSAAAILLERAAFPETFVDVPKFSED
jgi:hypothetical protein